MLIGAIGKQLGVKLLNLGNCFGSVVRNDQIAIAYIVGVFANLALQSGF